MWRLWTRGWGVRAWWFWFNDEGWPFWVARHLPRRVALWTFIRVYAADGQAPGPEYARAYAAWERMPSDDKTAVPMVHLPADAVYIGPPLEPATVPPGFVGEGSTTSKITPLEWGDEVLPLRPAGVSGVDYGKGDAFSIELGGQAAYVGPPVVSGLGYSYIERPDPTVFDLADPRFDVLWNRLKHFEITGNDIAALLDELDDAYVPMAKGPTYTCLDGHHDVCGGYMLSRDGQRFRCACDCHNGSRACPSCGRDLAGSFPKCIDCQLVDALKDGH